LCLRWIRFGSKLDFSTFLGGYQEDEGKAIALDAARHVYVAGWTSSSLFPTTGAFKNQPNGRSAGFVSQLDERGAKLEYSSLIGGSGSDVATAVALDIVGDIYVVGSTDSVDFPLRSRVIRDVDQASELFYRSRARALQVLPIISRWTGFFPQIQTHTDGRSDCVQLHQR